MHCVGEATALLARLIPPLANEMVLCTVSHLT